MNMDNSTETKQESSPGKLESLAKDADLKAEMEKAKEWIKTNPLPAGKSEIRWSFKYINSIYNRKTCNINLPTAVRKPFSAFWESLMGVSLQTTDNPWRTHAFSEWIHVQYQKLQKRWRNYFRIVLGSLTVVSAYFLKMKYIGYKM